MTKRNVVEIVAVPDSDFVRARLKDLEASASAPRQL